MTKHQHVSGEDLLERMTTGEFVPGASGCDQCEAEASALSHVLRAVSLADASVPAPTDWDDLLLRRRIREAVAEEKPHSRSIFDRYAVLRPALATALAASVVVAVWAPMSRNGDTPGTPLTSFGALSLESAERHLPAWTPLPEEAEDEGLAVLAEWTPNEDEFALAQCGAGCLSGLSHHEEESLLQAVGAVAPRSPLGDGTPL